MGTHYEYSIIESGVIAEVNLLERTCSSRKFDLVRIPCAHAMIMMRLKFGDQYGKKH